MLSLVRRDETFFFNFDKICGFITDWMSTKHTNIFLLQGLENGIGKTVCWLKENYISRWKLRLDKPPHA